MDALIDTNVLITYVTGREDPYKLSSVKIMEACSVGAINGYIAFHSLSTLWYVLRKYPEKARRDWLMQIVDLLSVAGADNTKIREAIEMDDFRDFEDCLQYECAKTAGVSYIITGNSKDYAAVDDLFIIDPDKALKILEKEIKS
ncbi:type II toxin-antitoxin system VapC family toxin [Bilifractor porci]|jgi:predicted nucleic acid-binding protein|uniref:PIN domain-containing protein n=1 Tax=Bilifractor porci TaxID=2606636 RepID=A0A7X2P906_9FIRM|nr:PIN domain-containing protein [Bilifractor porci]MST82440.1 PIN domain-containing protein [Bilifractor porci]